MKRRKDNELKIVWEDKRRSLVSPLDCLTDDQKNNPELQGSVNSFHDTTQCARRADLDAHCPLSAQEHKQDGPDHQCSAKDADASDY